VLLVLEQTSDSGRNVNVLIVVLSTGFQHDDLMAGIGRQPVGQHATSGSSADDQVIATQGIHGRVFAIWRLRSPTADRCFAV
jgi:hypothetical protein